MLGLLLLALIPIPMAAQNAIPQVNQPLSPSSAAPGGIAFTLTVNGTDFVSGAEVKWNGSPRATTFVSTSKLTAAISATDITKATTATITVTNPGPGGGSSAPAYFVVANSYNLISMVRTEVGAGSNPQAMAVGDFNGDGILDLAVANGGGNSVSIFLGVGNGTFGAPTNYATASGFPDCIVIGDFNGDGKVDIAVLLQRINEVSILLGNGDGTFGAHQEYATGQNPAGASVADVNGDGKLDLLISNVNGNTVSVLLGNGDGSFQNHQDYATGTRPQQVAVADFNGDGKLDLAVANGGDGTVSILLGNGDGSFQTHSDFACVALPTWIVAGDFNGDDKLDVALSSPAHNLSVLLGNGDGTLQTHKEFPTGNNSQMIASADLNADGKLDLVVANFTDNSVSALIGNGDGTFKGQTVYPTNAGPGWVVIGDFNRDGKMDFAVVDTSADSISVMIESPINLTPTRINYPTQQSGFPSTPQNVTLKNSSSSSIGVGAINIVGANPGDFSETDNCASTTLLAGTSCTISVTFTPLQLGIKNAQVIISLTNGSFVGIGLSGTGITSVKLSPPKEIFKPLLINTTSKPVTISFQNLSNITINVSSILINGKNPSEFSETNNCAPSVLPQGNCTFTVTYHPTMVGSESAGMNIFGNFSNGNGQQASILTGIGTAVSVTPTSLVYAAQTVGTTSAAKTVTLSNASSTALAVFISVQGTDLHDFAQTNTCAGSIPALGSCSISVTFSPAATGTRTAIVNVGDSDPTGPQTVSLTGTGQ